MAHALPRTISIPLPVKSFSVNELVALCISRLAALSCICRAAVNRVVDHISTGACLWVPHCVHLLGHMHESRVVAARIGSVKFDTFIMVKPRARAARKPCMHNGMAHEMVWQSAPLSSSLLRYVEKARYINRLLSQDTESKAQAVHHISVHETPES